MIKKIISQPKGHLHKGSRKRKQLYSWISIKSECEKHHRQFTKNITETEWNLILLYSQADMLIVCVHAPKLNSN